MLRFSKIEQNNAEISEKINTLKQEILIVTSNNIAGKNITKNLGIVRGISDTSANTKKEFNLAETEALFNMLSDAKKHRGKRHNRRKNIYSDLSEFNLASFSGYLYRNRGNNRLTLM